MKSHFIVVSKDKPLPSELLERTKWRSRADGDECSIGEVNCMPPGDDNHIAKQISQAGYERVFENCWLPKERIADGNAVFVRALFALIAAEYDGIITTCNNRGCYEHLYLIAKSKILTSRSRTLDFGCGTGQILGTNFVDQIEDIKGFDFSPEMLDIAEKHGLNVIRQPLIAETLKHRFDLILSAYVMHFGISEVELQRLINLLEPGGVFIANFHKNIQLNEVIQYLKRAPQMITFESSSSPFGTVLMVTRSQITSQTTMLLRLSELNDIQLRKCELFIRWGLIATIGNQKNLYVSAMQFQRLLELSHGDSFFEENASESMQLFPSDHELNLTNSTSIRRIGNENHEIPGAEVLIQLLPKTIKDSSLTTPILTAPGEIPLLDLGVNLISKDGNVLSAIGQQVSKFTQRFQDRERLSALARSASYMGTKTLLCPAICELVDNFHSPDGVIFDLMCGSGATAGAFARQREVYVSDAQAFARNLAIVQGGGMNELEARCILEQVIDMARNHFDKIGTDVQREIELEENFLMSELTGNIKQSFVDWAVSYPRVGNSSFNQNQSLHDEIAARKLAPFMSPGTLFTRYYANLFFGIRQAAEIDSLRLSIESLENPIHKKWALGALICAVSTCADSYAGHFAQPRFDSNSPERISIVLKKTMYRRTMSVTQEFSARLVNLAKESQSAKHAVNEIDGPWQLAMQRASETLRGKDVLVYLDPPYTRDEYSRYYHVLETLVQYNYPEVGGKASIPVKGSDSRFASEFFTRTPSAIEDTIAKIISTCLENNWSCLWSYSSIGMARIENVINRLSTSPKILEIFKAKYSYKPQGKRSALPIVQLTESSLAEGQFEHSSMNKIQNKLPAIGAVDEFMIFIK